MGNLYCGHIVGLWDPVLCPAQHRKQTEWSPLLSFQEIEQKLSRIAYLCDFLSALSVIIERRRLHPAEFQLPF
jgi:hypothetical protein